MFNAISHENTDDQKLHSDVKTTKERMLLTYSELLNSLDGGATAKITRNNHRLNRRDFTAGILMPMQENGLDEYRQEYNDTENAPEAAISVEDFR